MDTLAPALRSTRSAVIGGHGRHRSSFPERLETGDLLLIRTGSGIGRIVRALDRTAYNHCGIHIGDGQVVHVLPPKSLRGPCVAIQPFEEMVTTLEPHRIEVHRPLPDLALPLAAGALDVQKAEPAFSFNDLLLLATIADTSDRLADAIEPVGSYLADQQSWESILAAHFGVAGPDAITCSELVVRSLPAEGRSALTRTRRSVPDAWQVPIDAGEPLASDLAEIVAGLPVGSTRLHRRRGYTPVIAALGDYAIASGLDDLETPHLRVALSTLRHLASDFDGRWPLDLHRLRRILDAVVGSGQDEWLARLTTPGDLARSVDVFEPTGLTWISTESTR